MKNSRKRYEVAEIHEWIGKRLTEFLSLKGCTIADVARKLGRDPSYLYRIGRGEENPTVEQIEMIVKACGSTLAEFFAPMAREKTAQENVAEDDAVLATVKKLLNDPASRAGIIASVFGFARLLMPGKDAPRKK
jgi:transcriptional regulator with XRE-family HTH domain